MNLDKMFERQRELDAKIVKEHGLEGQDLVNHKVLAFQVELAELCNEWRGFKIWSRDREPRREKMLEEYADALHFLLSVGLELGVNPGDYRVLQIIKRDTLLEQMITLNSFANGICSIYALGSKDLAKWTWSLTFRSLIGLADLLGFTTEEIEDAYFRKNNIN